MATQKPLDNNTPILDGRVCSAPIRAEDACAEPPLLTDSLDAEQMPLLSERISAPRPTEQQAAPAQASKPTNPLQNRPPPSAASAKFNTRLRAAAQVVLQEVLDDFAPQIEAELQRRLEARLDQLIAQRTP
ncbi:MAG: DNA polymerase III subunit chi [Pseudomonas sp.]